MNPLARKQKILEAAIRLSLTSGYRNITRKDVALSAQSAQGLIGHYFINITNLKKEVLKEAVKREIIPILIENLSDRESERIQLHPALKQKVINYLTN